MNLRVDKLFMILNKICVLFLTARTLHSSDTKSNYSNDSNNITEIFVSLQVHVNVFNRLAWLAVVAGKQKEESPFQDES